MWTASSDAAAGARKDFALCRHCASSLAMFLGRSIAEPVVSELPEPTSITPPWVEPGDVDKKTPPGCEARTA